MGLQNAVRWSRSRSPQITTEQHGRGERTEKREIRQHGKATWNYTFFKVVLLTTTPESKITWGGECRLAIKKEGETNLMNIVDDESMKAPEVDSETRGGVNANEHIGSLYWWMELIQASRETLPPP